MSPSQSLEHFYQHIPQSFCFAFFFKKKKDRSVSGSGRMSVLMKSVDIIRNKTNQILELYLVVLHIRSALFFFRQKRISAIHTNVCLTAAN